MKNKLFIGTRGSQLALWQAKWVKKALESVNPGIPVELAVIKTKGDKILDVPLAKVGGKGLFVKEIEEALINGKIDLAVHSMKDMPAALPEGLIIGAIPKRASALDAFVSESCENIESLGPNARVGTSSLRRAAQLLHLMPDITIEPLRGNIDTRLKKLTSENLDAIILAAAGLERLGLTSSIKSYLPAHQMLPAVGQGALCIETRQHDEFAGPIAAKLEDPDTRTAVIAERGFLNRLEGGCQVPIAAHAVVEKDQVIINGLVAELDGSRIIHATEKGPRADAETLGVNLAEDLLKQGADDILERLQQDAG
ncbi:MAG: hydroxymethylbilane synthase [Desulfobacteraceae bacterium]|nr:hydroxymethylbilane synthase [Desulfobacteraceae bacterium]